MGSKQKNLTLNRVKMCNLSSKHPRRLKLTSKLMSIKLKEILTKNGPYPTPLNPISSQAKADPGLAPAM